MPKSMITYQDSVPQGRDIEPKKTYDEVKDTIKVKHPTLIFLAR